MNLFVLIEESNTIILRRSLCEPTYSWMLKGLYGYCEATKYLDTRLFIYLCTFHKSMVI